jgi:hypothetical protein
MERRVRVGGVNVSTCFDRFSIDTMSDTTHGFDRFSIDAVIDTMRVDSTNDCRCDSGRSRSANFGADLREIYVNHMSHFPYVSPEAETKLRGNFGQPITLIHHHIRSTLY